MFEDHTTTSRDPATPGLAIVNAFSVDVEDYFQVAAFDDVVERRNWSSMEMRVERNVDILLAKLDERRVKATFFTLGWIAERFPHMVRRIVHQGHELASHGYSHQKLDRLTREALREDLVCAKGLLEDIGGVRIVGYRAPSFSIGAKNLWAHDMLAETGHLYSSSVYPVKTDHYGMPDAPRFAWQTEGGLLEIPPTSIRLGNSNFPASGGGYFRLLPFAISQWGFNRVNQEGQAAIFYCHPWEIDADQPRIKAARALSRFRHYVNLDSNLAKIDHLLSSFLWDRMDIVFKVPGHQKL